MSNTGGAGQTICCNLDTTLELIGISFSVFVVIYVVICFARYLLVRWRTPGGGGGGAARARRQKPGLDASAIAALPSFAYRGTGGDEEERSGSVECAVCLSSVEEGEMVRVLPSCEHMFHAACIDLWLQKHGSCPVCRADAEPGKAAGKAKSGGRRTHRPPSPELGGGAVVVLVDVGETSGTKRAELGSTSMLSPPMWSGRSVRRG
ncbi:RING-H2 finger protein ATL39-like [Canna indica]|uniref:RING-type E3 ubiquitin transferase n=1 Tax=Canna indica TaxID=4628 RepID=A0AAQ3KL75_9LILI|nr:RING-H2 finger protein ATL39-like [Canna indica]